MTIKIDQFMCREDNFGVLIHDPESGQTALIDAPQEAPILAAVERTGWKPSLLLITHHHADHVEANLALKKRFSLKIVGPEAEKAKIPGIDETVGEGSRVPFGGEQAEVIFTPATPPAMCPTTSRNRSCCFPPTRCLRWAAGGCSNARRR